MSVQIKIKVTVPELVLNSAVVRNAIMSKMQRKTAPDLQRLFKQTTNGWQNPPAFLQRFTNSPSHVSTEVWPGQNSKGGKIYSLVNQGSPPHRIGPRKAKMLVFQRNYRASTRPRVLSSRSYSRYGDIVRTAQTFTHPGFEAREFDAEIAAQYADTFAEDMQDAIRVATVRSV